MRLPNLSEAWSAPEQELAQDYARFAAENYSANKEALITRLHRIQGQVRGIERMVEDDRYCVDIVTQLGAVSTATESLAFEILDNHVNHCVTRAIASRDEEEATAKAEELLAAVHRFAKTR